MVAASWFQVTPWSVLFQTPPPLVASVLKVLSPDPKYIVFAFVGSWQILPTDMFVKKSFIGTHVAGLVLKFIVFHKPPPIPPAQTVFPDASERSTHIAFILPDATATPPSLLLPLLTPTTSAVGPLSTQEAVVVRLRMARCLLCSAMSYASISLSFGT